MRETQATDNKRRFDSYKVIARRIMAFVFAVGVAQAVYSNPIGGQVTSGSATIQQTATTTQVNQTSDKAIINWQSFNIAPGEATNFTVPNSNSMTLNRINPGQGASQIFGQLTSNGRLVLVNQSGIYFSPTAYVNVSSLIASTRDITDENFLAGKLAFDQPSTLHGTVINQGTIIAADHGLVALIGSNVSNQGLIQANLGNVVLASGNKFTIDLTGDGLINFTVDEQSSGSGVDQNGNIMLNGVSNAGTIIANGGKILLTANNASGIIDSAINMSGVAQAQSVSQQNGEIIFDGGANGTVNVSGLVDASGTSAGETGGTVKVLGSNIQVASSALINVSGYNGGGIIDIGGDLHGAGTDPNSLTTTINPGAILNANALVNGDGGQVVVWSDLDTQFAGSITAMGGALGGNGGYVETSGGYLNVAGGTVNTLAASGAIGSWLLDPSDIYIAVNQAAATAAGMSGTDGSANTESSNTFAASGAVPSSLLTTANLDTALGTSNVLVTTTNASGTGTGNIFVVSPVTWGTTSTLTLNAANNITINSNGASPMINATAGGGLTLTAGNDVLINGGITLTGTSAYGLLAISAANTSESITTGANGAINVENFNLQQGQWYQDGTLPSFSVANNFQIDSGVAAPTGVQFLRASSGSGTSGNPYVLQDIYGLQGINSSTTLLADSFQLGGNINAATTANWNSGAGFIPIGNSTAFTGGFNGENNTINSLYINNSTLTNVGLFSVITAGSNSIQNVGITSANITATDSGSNVGILAGTTTSGTINNVYTTGTISGNNNNTGGGLFGTESGGVSGSISNSYSLANISNVNTAGGIAGYNNSNISNSWFGGTVSSSSITGGIVGYGGGGSNNFTISNTYNIGALSVSGGDNLVGGIVGYSHAPLTIQDSFNAGYLSGTTKGGIVAAGQSGASTLINDYWDTQTSGVSTTSNGASTITTGAMTTAALQSTAVSTLFPSDASWANGILGSGTNADGAYPYLTVFNSSTPRVISGFAPGGSETATGLGGTSVSLSYNGSVIATTTTGANGFYYFLETNGTVADNNPYLVFLSSGATVANVVGLATAGGVSDVLLNMTANTINVYGNNTTAITSTNLGTAIGSLAANNLLYSASGANLTLGTATDTTANLITLASTQNAAGVITTSIPTDFTVNSTVATVSGGTTSVNFSESPMTTMSGAGITTSGAQSYGAVTLSGADTLTSTGDSGITFGSTINGAGSLSIANNSGALSFGGALGGGTALTSLTIGTGDATTLNNNVTTTGGQIYNSAVSSNSNVTLTTGASGDITIGGGYTMTGANTLSLVSGRDIFLNNANTISIANGTLSLSAANAAASITSGSFGSTNATGVAENINVANFNLLQGQWSQVGTLPGFTVSNNFQIDSGAATPTGVQFLRASSGSGTSLSPYVLQDIYGVQGINSSAALSADYFQLGSNISASGTSNWNGGTGFIPIENFSGDLNGVFNVISGLYINTSTLNEGGLIGILAGSVENLGLTNVNITTTLNNGNAAALAAFVNVNGSVSNSFSTGVINVIGTGAQVIAGGLIGTLDPGSISNSYSMVTINVNVAANSLILDFGGLLGRILGASTVSDSYSTGAVTLATNSHTGLSKNIGGLIGLASGGTTTNSYWDVNTSGLGTAGSTSGSAGGTGESTATLQSGSLTAFSSNPWGIISGTSYPYLADFYAGGTPSVISGIAVGSTTAGDAIQLADNGANLANSGLTQGMVTAGANGFYYFLEPNGTISNGDDLLVYLSGATTKGNVVGIANSGGDITSFNISAANNINIGALTDTNAYSNATLLTAVGNLYSDTDILFSNSSGNLLLGNATNKTANLVDSSSGLAYAITSAIGIGSGATNTSVNFAGAVTASNSVTTQNAQTYSGAVTLSDANVTLTSNNAAGITFGSTVDGAQALNIAANSGAVTFSGLVGNGTALTSLTIGAGDATAINASINTSGAQTYNSAVTLGGSGVATLSSTGAGGINFNSTLDGSQGLNIANGSGAVTFGGLVGNTTALASLAIGTGDATAVNVASINTTGSQTYGSALTLGVNSVFNVTANNSAIALNAGIVNSAGENLTLQGNAGNTNTFSLIGPFTLANITVTGGSGGSSTLQVGNANLTWNITGANTGNLTNISDSSITGAFDFSNIANLTGGTGSNNFAINDGASISGSINGGTNASADSISFNYSTPVSVNLAATDYAGTALNNSSNPIAVFTNIGAVNNVATLTTSSSIPSAINITAGGVGVVNDPVSFSGVTTIIGNASTTVNFGVQTTFDSSTGVANVNGFTMQFTNIPTANFSGNLVVNSPASQPSTTQVNSANSALGQISLQTFAPTTTSTTTSSSGSSSSGSSDSSSGSSSSSSSGSSSSSSSDSSSSSSSDSSSSSSSTSPVLATPAAITVNQTVQTLLQTQTTADTSIKSSQQVTTGGICGR